MKNLIALSISFLPLLIFGQDVSKLHFKAILVDTHNDVLTSQTLDGHDISHRLSVGHSDLDRWKEGGVDVQFFSIWTGTTPRNKEGFFKDAMQQIDSLYSIVARNQSRMVLAKTYNDVKKAVRQHKLAALIGVEGGHMIENDMAKFEELSQRGMRYMTLTWNNSTPWATSAMDETRHADSLPHKGLTDFGKQIVRRMNELGIMVDLSHTGEQTFYDALSVTTKPVLLSHSSVWNIASVFRNVKDDQIRAVAKNGGVICINFYSGFIGKDYEKHSDWLNDVRKKPFQDSILAINKDSATMIKQWENYYQSEMKLFKPTLAQMVDHIDYIVKLIGVNYVGIGSDFDGVSSLPTGIDDVTSYPKITAELKRRGYSNGDIKKILGKNVLRVMKANFK